MDEAANVADVKAVALNKDGAGIEGENFLEEEEEEERGRSAFRWSEKSNKRKVKLESDAKTYWRKKTEARKKKRAAAAPPRTRAPEKVELESKAKTWHRKKKEARKKKRAAARPSSTSLSLRKELESKAKTWHKKKKEARKKKRAWVITMPEYIAAARRAEERKEKVKKNVGGY